MDPADNKKKETDTNNNNKNKIAEAAPTIII
jgi:hypothetical protein